jgi:glycosyltransferase involved in cell wall biosynthesis
MKVALVNDYPEAYGAEEIVQTLAKSLRDKGTEVILYCSSEHPQCPSEIDFIKTPSSFMRINLVNRKVYNWFKKEFKEKKPDVIHTHNLAYMTFAPIIAGKECGIKIIHTHHDYRAVCPMNMMFKENHSCTPTGHCFKHVFSVSKKFSKYLKLTYPESFYEYMYAERRRKKILSILEGVVNTAPNPEMAKTLSNVGINTIAIPNGIDIPEIYEQNHLRKAMHLDNKPLVGHFGMIAKHKGIEQLKMAMTLIPKEKMNFLFTNMSQIREKLNNNRSFILGRMPRIFELSLMATCDIIIACSIWNEPFNLTITEGMGLGKTVIASDTAGHKIQIIHGKTGILYDKNDPKKLAEYIIELAREGDFRDEIGHNAKERYNAYFTGNAMTNRFLGLYR